MHSLRTRGFDATGNCTVVELNHDQNAAACFVTPVIGFAHGQEVERRKGNVVKIEIVSNH